MHTISMGKILIFGFIGRELLLVIVVLAMKLAVNSSEPLAAGPGIDFSRPVPVIFAGCLF